MLGLRDYKGGSQLDKIQLAPITCQEDKYELDKQWLALIAQAKQVGLSQAEVRHFFEYNKQSNRSTILKRD